MDDHVQASYFWETYSHSDIFKKYIKIHNMNCSFKYIIYYYLIWYN